MGVGQSVNLQEDAETAKGAEPESLLELGPGQAGKSAGGEGDQEEGRASEPDVDPERGKEPGAGFGHEQLLDGEKSLVRRKTQGPKRRAEHEELRGADALADRGGHR